MIARIALALAAHRRRLAVAAIVLAPTMMSYSNGALADENGISFWVPGLFGSLAATPQQPGWSWANIYYHTSVSAGADVARAREFTLNRVPGNVTLNANLNLSINATGNLGFVLPSYVFADAGARRPGVSVPLGGLRRRRHQLGGDLVRCGHGPVRQQRFPSCCPTASATRRGALGIWRRCSN